MRFADGFAARSQHDAGFAGRKRFFRNSVFYFGRLTVRQDVCLLELCSLNLVPKHTFAVHLIYASRELNGDFGMWNVIPVTVVILTRTLSGRSAAGLDEAEGRWRCRAWMR